jgi:hypothetical protein
MAASPATQSAENPTTAMLNVSVLRAVGAVRPPEVAPAA